MEIQFNRKYTRKTDSKYEVYVIGRGEHLPDKKPKIIYVTLIDGACKICDEELFAKAYQLDLP